VFDEPTITPHELVRRNYTVTVFRLSKSGLISVIANAESGV